MTPLEHLSLARRIIIIVLALLAGLFIVLASRFAEAEPPQTNEPYLYEGIPLDAHLIELDKQALEEAYVERIKLLWGVFLKNRAESGREMASGLKLAREAYNMANKQILRRRQELNVDQKNKEQSK